MCNCLVEKVSFSTLPDFACSIEQVFVFFFFCTWALKSISFYSPTFPLHPGVCQPSHKTVYKIITVTRKCQQHALFGCHSPWTEAVVVTPCTSSGGTEPWHPGAARSARLLQPIVSQSRVQPQTLLCCDLINGIKAGSQHLLVNWHLNGNCQRNINIWLLSYELKVKRRQRCGWFRGRFFFSAHFTYLAHLYSSV